jgi:ribulose kinase
MACSREATFVPGIWGPYFDAMLPGMWLTEGGQSSVGSLVDHVVQGHEQFPELRRITETTGASSIFQVLNDRVRNLDCGFRSTRDLHVLPYFHGNRSPRADPSLLGLISGLKLSNTLDDLTRLYLATIQALAYGTKHIIEEMNQVLMTFLKPSRFFWLISKSFRMDIPSIRYLYRAGYPTIRYMFNRSRISLAAQCSSHMSRSSFFNHVS